MNEIGRIQGKSRQQSDGDRIHDGTGPDITGRTGKPRVYRPLRNEWGGGGTEQVSDDSDESDDVHVICFQQNQREEVRILGERAGALTAESGMHNTNFLVLNDQGGSVMDVSDRAGCLRAQEHGHQPVVCFEKENYNE